MEVTDNSSIMQFKGPAQKNSTLITYQGVLKLIMALPGINAREIRTKFADIIQRYFAGDPSLVGELVENNMSTAPINQLAREDLGNVPMLTMEDVENKAVEVFNKRQCDLEDEFKKRRKMVLYDKRMEEIRKERDVKREIKVLESQTKLKEAVAMITMEETKQRVAEEEARVKLAEEEARVKLAEEETKRKQEDTKVKLSQEETRRMELQLELLKIQKGQPEPSAPAAAILLEQPYLQNVTVSRVATTCIPLGTMPESQRNKILSKAGRICASTIPHVSTKIKDVFDKFPEFLYKPENYEAIKEQVLKAYNEEMVL